MKSIKIIIVSVVCAMLALGAMSLPAGASSSAFALGTLTSPVPTPVPSGCVARSVANIRSGPSTRYRIVGRLPRNGAFVITSRSGLWSKGTSRWGNGWVLTSLLRCTK